MSDDIKAEVRVAAEQVADLMITTEDNPADIDQATEIVETFWLALA